VLLYALYFFVFNFVTSLKFSILYTQILCENLGVEINLYMKNSLKILFYLLILRGVLACKHEPIPITMTPIITESPDSCGVKNVTYNKTIRPIFNQYCVSCHGDQRMSKGYNFQEYQITTLWFKNDSTQILNVIRHEKGLSVPLGGDKLPECKIRQIETWVREGFKEN
jgi:hypothetical protein